MMELGILVAWACDIVIGGNLLEQSIADFGSANLRLMHHHSELDKRIIKQSNTNRRNLVNNAAAAVTPVLDHMDMAWFGRGIQQTISQKKNENASYRNLNEVLSCALCPLAEIPFIFLDEFFLQLFTTTVFNLFFELFTKRVGFQNLLV
jgi:hypothetical protein